jgi:hypothetical protein
MATIISIKTALIEVPPPESLATTFTVWSALDWAKISNGALTLHLWDMVAFADAWAAIERRWAEGDYSVREHRLSARAFATDLPDTDSATHSLLPKLGP